MVAGEVAVVAMHEANILYNKYKKHNTSLYVCVLFGGGGKENIEGESFKVCMNIIIFAWRGEKSQACWQECRHG